MNARSIDPRIVATLLVAVAPLLVARTARADEPSPLPPPAAPAVSSPPPLPPSPSPSVAAPAAPPPLVLGASVVPAPPEVPPPSPPPVIGLGSKRDFIKISAGVRVGYVSDRTFNAFASTDALPGASFAATRTILAKDALALAVGLGWDVAGRGSDARGQDASFVTHRLTVPIEGRYHALPWLYGFVKLAPGAVWAAGTIADASAPNKLAASGWGAAADASLGASVLFGSHAPRARARFWLMLELGWMTTSAIDFAMTPRDRDDPRAFAPTRLGSLGMNGPFFRVSADLSF